MIPVYRSDSYLRSLETVADSVVDDGGTQLVICREALFAEGGGQPRDFGTISFGGVEREVLELIKHKGDIRLRINPIDGLIKGSSLRCDIDFARRYRIMRLHTAQHSLAGSIRRTIGNYGTGGMQIDDDAQTCTMYFQAEQDFGDSHLSEALKVFHEVVSRGAAVRTETIENIADAPKLFGDHFRPGDPAVTIRGRVRMVIIEGLDANACGGTHLRNTNEIGALRETTLAPDSEPRSYALTFSLEPRSEP